MSKGAEWDVVAVPGLAEGTFPGINKSDPENWITNEKHIPFQLRGDSAELPVFSFNGAMKNSEAKKEIEAYGKVCNATKIREEIRLGYVAFTRARTHLIATTSWWRDGADWVKPSSIFEQVALVAQNSGTILNNAVQPEDDDKNPKLENPATGIWPRDPLGNKRAEFESKIELVNSAKPIDLSKFVETDLEIISWAQDAQALIHETTLLRNGDLEIALPLRLSTSTLVALHKDPTELALLSRQVSLQQQANAVAVGQVSSDPVLLSRQASLERQVNAVAARLVSLDSALLSKLVSLKRQANAVAAERRFCAAE
jgi:DNA helicase-2/ATP-dependent DNA helicase PcrA